MTISSLVRAVRDAYRFWYRGTRVCGCDGEAPNSLERDVRAGDVGLAGYDPDDIVTITAVCEAHEWIRQRTQLQQRIVDAGLSYPIPKASLRSATDKQLEAIKRNLERILEPNVNPLQYHFINGVRGNGEVAGQLAKWLAEVDLIDGHARTREHVVFLMHNTQAVNLTFGQREQEVDDVLLNAPVLVFWDNVDKRNGDGRIMPLLQSRQDGICLVVQ